MSGLSWFGFCSNFVIGLMLKRGTVEPLSCSFEASKPTTCSLSEGCLICWLLGVWNYCCVVGKFGVDWLSAWGVLGLLCLRSSIVFVPGCWLTSSLKVLLMSCKELGLAVFA